jgi:hypothetical protein
MPNGLIRSPDPRVSMLVWWNWSYPPLLLLKPHRPTGQADNITVVSIQPATLEKCATS